MAEHLYHTEKELTNERNYIDPEMYMMIGTLGAAAIAGVSGVMSSRSSSRAEKSSQQAQKNSAETKETVNGMSERNKALSNARITKETNLEAVDDALCDVVEAIVWTLHRSNIGNGELTEAVSALANIRREARKQKEMANLRIQAVDTNNENGGK